MKQHASKAPDLDHLEARFAQRVATALTEVSHAPDHAISERLRVAREQAVARAREVRRAQAAAAPATVRVGRDGAGVLGWLSGPRAWFPRLAMTLPAVVLAVGMLAIDQEHDQAQLEASADADLALLSDDVPPSAYSDEGFREYLRATGATLAR